MFIFLVTIISIQTCGLAFMIFKYHNNSLLLNQKQMLYKEQANQLAQQASNLNNYEAQIAELTAEKNDINNQLNEALTEIAVSKTQIDHLSIHNNELKKNLA